MNKIALLDHVIERLEVMLNRAEQAREDAQSDANAHLGRQQSRYDTFKEEAQYLAAAHERRIAEIASWLGACMSLRRQLLNEVQISLHSAGSPGDKAVRAGSLVTIIYYRDDGTLSDPVALFILPCGFGEEIAGEGIRIPVFSSDSPVARALLGKKQGEETEIPWTPVLSDGGDNEFRGEPGQRTVRTYIVEVV